MLVAPLNTNLIQTHESTFVHETTEEIDSTTTSVDPPFCLVCSCVHLSKVPQCIQQTREPLRFSTTNSRSKSTFFLPFLCTISPPFNPHIFGKPLFRSLTHTHTRAHRILRDSNDDAVLRRRRRCCRRAAAHWKSLFLLFFLAREKERKRRANYPASFPLPPVGSPKLDFNFEKLISPLPDGCPPSAPLCVVMNDFGKKWGISLDDAVNWHCWEELGTKIIVQNIFF